MPFWGHFLDFFGGWGPRYATRVGVGCGLTGIVWPMLTYFPFILFFRFPVIENLDIPVFVEMVDIDTEYVSAGPNLDGEFRLDSMAMVGSVYDVFSKFSLSEGAIPSLDFLTEWGRTNIP